MQNYNSMSDRLSITPRSHSRESDMFGVDILGATLLLTKEFHTTVCPPYNAVVRVHDVIARYK